MSEFRLISAILRNTWLIHPEWVNQHGPFISRLIAGENVQLNDQRAEPFAINALNGNRFFKDYNEAPKGAVAVIAMEGPVMKHDGWCSYGSRSFSQMIAAADDHPNISSIVLRVDSPGGQVDGTPTLADTIRNVRKPVITLVDGMAASAMYWIGSAADEMWASQKVDFIGSIGVYSSYSDYVAMYERLGVKFHDIYSRRSPEKNKGIREARKGNYEALQDELDYIADKFIEAVKLNRKGKLNLEAGDPFKGAIYHAEQAVEIGLIDGIMSFDAAVSRAYELSQDKNFSKSHNNMYGNKYPKLHALRGLAAEAVTDEQLESINAELQKNGVTAVSVVSQASMDEAEQAVTDLAAAQEKITSLQGQLATAAANVISWKEKAESYGSQPGETPTTPKKEGNEITSEDKKDPFYTEVDAEIDAILKTQ